MSRRNVVTYVLIIGLTLVIVPKSYAGLDLLYSTGEPMPVMVIADGTTTNGGYISGFFSASQPGRYSASAFTIEDTINIQEIVAWWFDSDDNPDLPPFTTFEWTFYADDAGGGPGTIVAEGQMPASEVLAEDWAEPVGGIITDWQRRFNLDVTLDPGTYWVSFHGIEGSIGWLTGALDGWPELYRANNVTDYTLYTNTVWETPDDPERVYHVAFELYGSSGGAGCDGDANGDNVVDPLDSGFVLSRFGCSVGTGDPDCDAADQNGDGVVDPLDVGYVLSRFGPCDAGLTAPQEPDTQREPIAVPGSGSNALD